MTAMANVASTTMEARLKNINVKRKKVVSLIFSEAHVELSISALEARKMQVCLPAAVAC